MIHENDSYVRDSLRLQMQMTVVQTVTNNLECQVSVVRTQINKLLCYNQGQE